MEAVVGPPARKNYGEAVTAKRQYDEIWRGFKRFGPDALGGGLRALFHDKKVFPQDPSADLVRAAHRFSRFVTALNVLIVSRVVHVDSSAVASRLSDMLMGQAGTRIRESGPYILMMPSVRKKQASASKKKAAAAAAAPGFVLVALPKAGLHDEEDEDPEDENKAPAPTREKKFVQLVPIKSVEKAHDHEVCQNMLNKAH
eukprot:g15980.t1